MADLINIEGRNFIRGGVSWNQSKGTWLGRVADPTGKYTVQELKRRGYQEKANQFLKDFQKLSEAERNRRIASLYISKSTAEQIEGRSLGVRQTIPSPSAKKDVSPTTTKGGGRFQIPTLRSQRKTTSPTFAVKRSKEGGGTITVTQGGLVTERDNQGRLIKRYNTSRQIASNFVKTESTKIRDAITLKQKQKEIISANKKLLLLTGGNVLGSIAAKKFAEKSLAERKKWLLRQTVSASLPVSNLLAERTLDKINKDIQIAIKQLTQGTLTATKKEKGLAGALQQLSKAKEIELQKIEEGRFKQKGRGTLETIFRGTVILGSLGALRGALGVVETFAHPIKTAKAQFEAFRPKNFMTTIKGIATGFTIDPVGTIVEFYTYGKVLNMAGKGIKKSPVARYINEEMFIRALPKELQSSIRSFLKSDKVQKRINPGNIPSINKADFLKVKSLTKVEVSALIKTLKSTDSVIFGSFASKVLGKRPKVKTKLPMPKDVDLATRSVTKFNEVFMKNLPKSYRQNLIVKGEKIVRRGTGEAILDVKPISRLVPSKSLLTGRGELPVLGFVRKITKTKGSILPTIKKVPGQTRLTMKTGKIVKTTGIKLIGFGEQTTRKFLGTLQVLIEKNIRRAKDPQGLLLSLKIQLETLKLQKPKTRLGKSRLRSKVKTLSNSIKILQSKAFSKLLEKKVPGLTKDYPLLGKINVDKLKKVDIPKLNKKAKLAAKRAKPIPVEKESVKKAKINEVFKNPKKISITQEIQSISKLPKVQPSRLPRVKPSRLPKVRPSRLPSKLPSKLPSRLSKLPTSKLSSVLKHPSKLSSIIPKNSKLSKLPPSKLTPSKIPASKLRPSRLSKLPASKVPASKLKPKKFKPIITQKKVIFEQKEREKELNKAIHKLPLQRKLIYIPDLYSRLYEIKANKSEKMFFLKPGRVFSGIFIRKIT